MCKYSSANSEDYFGIISQKTEFYSIVVDMCKPLSKKESKDQKSIQ